MGHTNVVKVLLHYGAIVNQQNYVSGSMYYYGCCGVVFLSKIMYPMQQKRGDTPLIVACLTGHIDTAKVLLDHGAIIDHPNMVKLLQIIKFSWY